MNQSNLAWIRGVTFEEYLKKSPEDLGKYRQLKDVLKGSRRENIIAGRLNSLTRLSQKPNDSKNN